MTRPAYPIMPKPTLCFTHVGTCATLLMALLIAGCEHKSTPTTKPPPPSNIDTSTAGGAARALLTLLQDHCAAMAASDHQHADTARDQIIWYVLDRNALRPLRQRTEGGPVLGAGLPRFRHLVESWASATMYYADGFALDQLTVHPTRDESWSTVRVPAYGPNDSASIHIACLKDPHERWHVVALNFEPDTPHTPTTTPATQPGN